MWRLELYRFIHKHPRIGNWLRKPFFLRTLMPFVFNFDHYFSDRRYMTEQIIPALVCSKVKRVLFVGCKEYTAHYGKKFTRAGIEYWTTDIDPTVTLWGAKHHHIVGDITKIDEFCDAQSFDAVLLNGVFGDGVDDEASMNRAVKAIAHILRTNGIFLIGWRSDKKHATPMELEAVVDNFRCDSVLQLPSTKTFPDNNHVYNWLIKTNEHRNGRISVSS